MSDVHIVCPHCHSVNRVPSERLASGGRRGRCKQALFLGAYAWYHLSALEKASRLSRESLTPEQVSALSLAALADEAFAIHFLADAYAAGHVAGTWGDASQRKGTHDYYIENGMEAMRREGGSIVLMGDAWMRPEDAERAAENVRISLEQILDAASGRGLAAGLQYIRYDEALAPDTFNTCKLETMPKRTAPPGIRPLFASVIKRVPVPGLGRGWLCPSATAHHDAMPSITARPSRSKR